MKKILFNKNFIKRLLVMVIITGMFFCAFPSMVFALEADTSYIYFDLRAAEVVLNESTYSGYIYETNEGVTSLKKITGSHKESNKYYVYQSTSNNVTTTGLVDGVMYLPDYDPIYVDGKLWREYISNNTDVLGIIDEWNSQTNGLRQPTENRLLISVAGKKCNVTIDNIWATKQTRGSMTGGSISIDKANTVGTHITLNLKGDNRIGSLRYYCSQTGDKSTLTINSYYGDKSEEGSLTAIGNQKLAYSNGNYTYLPGQSNNVAANHWDSVIGGTDGSDQVRGLKIKGGTIYSGSTPRENCTAIGGGGNGIGHIVISGGNITGVAYTTGTAIGGGIAHTSYGGTSDITISDGKVYAYNFGQPAHDVIKTYGTSDATLIEAASHIAGTAIGGASSILNTGNQTTAKIKITGGEVYAESLGGCGIGAGNSVNTTAGSANVIISGGKVTANSKGYENYTFEDGKQINIKPGVAIGGGTGGIQGNGGSAEITISGGTIKTGSIGGGSTTNKNGKIGYANINISGGDIDGQFIRVKGATQPCSFKMTAGKIHDSNTSDTEYARLQENGGALYMDDPTGVATISGGSIENCVGENGGAVYMTAGTFNLDGNAKIENCESNDLGGAIYLGKTETNKGTFNMKNGSIVNNIALNGNGGAIYLDGGDANVSGGTIEANQSINGGGAYLAGGTLNVTGGSFKSNIATNNGGGAFVNSGNIEMSGGSFDGNKAIENGGGVYLAGGTLNVFDGNISNNEAKNGAGAYLAGGALNISDGLFSENIATNNGGGAFVNSGNIEMSGGSFDGNEATNNGGGVYLTGGTLDITDGLFTNNNASLNGGGAYVIGGDFILNGDSAKFENNTALNGGGVYLTGGTPNLFKGSLIGNVASKDGGGIYIDTQIVTLAPIGDVVITQNKAGYVDKDNTSGNEGRGGGIFIGGTPGINDAGFSVDLSSTGIVSILENTAKDYGGGVCINNGFFEVAGTNIKVGKNTALNGGGVAVLAGNFDLSAGTIGGVEEANNATNGGGVYVSGGDVLITETGSIDSNTAIQNGGGVFVANGNVKMIGGFIDKNTAINGNGGGIYVSANNKDVSVELLSGSVTNNKSNVNGGAVAVVGNKSGSETIAVTIGVNKNHYDSAGNFISCEHGDAIHSTYECPIITNNTSNGKGGAVYITGGKLTKLNVYCLEEENNVSLGDKDRSNFMMVEGGSVVISTSENNQVDGGSGFGHNIISGSIRVTAGQMDIYGSMDNPRIDSPITVDITSEEDYYRDHRDHSIEEKYYKLQYFENFKNPDGVVTGQYTIYQIKHGDSVEISGVIYSHPGYEIIGWFTQANGGGTKYDVGQNVVFNNDPVGDLKIYAIWQAHSYYVEFDPNVPDGVLYEGTMEKVQYTYNTEYNLPTNQFVYPGHIFTGWKDQYGNSYEDAQLVSNLTGIDGDTIYLTAQWVECSHDINDPNYVVTYTYGASGNVLTKKCNCDGHEETITINASNAVYDGNTHNAQLVYSDGTWDELVEFIHTKDDVVLANAINAGNYKVTLSYAGVTAKAEFTIDKADQVAPNKPSFTPVDDGDVKKIIVTNSTSDISGKEYDYRISYFSNTTIIDLEWQKSNEFSLPVTCTNYIIFIRYAETENYNASPETRADQTYYYSTEVSVIIDCCEGFLCQLQENANSGLDIIVIVLDGYYKSSEFDVTVVTRYTEDKSLALEQAKVSADKKLLYDIPSGNDKKYEITLTIVGAKKIVDVESSIQNSPTFGDVTSGEALIGRDSSFTALFVVKDYESYQNIRLVFGQNLPLNTRIIFVDKINNTYWYYNVDTSVNTISLEDFTQMGGTTKFVASGSYLQYQFIVDFALTDNGCPGDSISISLDADPLINDGTIPAFENTQRNVQLEDVTFEVRDETPVDQIDLEKDISFDFALSSGTASKWDNKTGAFVIIPIDELPKDAMFKLIQDKATAYYYQNENGHFIIPIADLSIDNLTISLESSLFPEEGATYNVHLIYYASKSEVGASPMNGYLVDEIATLAFTAKAKENVAIKISGTDRVIKVGGTLDVYLEYILPSNCTISSDLMRKGDDGEYSSSGARPVITGPGELSISLAGLDEGSYCLRVIIKDSDGITLMSVPYYFVIYNSSGSTIAPPQN